MKICKTCQKPYSGRGRFYCSRACLDLDPEVREQRSSALRGKSQSPEHIAKRVLNTCQATKEKTRKATMIERYGVQNPTELQEVVAKISLKNLGRECPRTADHQATIIESRRTNGTLKHRPKTKMKISASLIAHYQGDRPCSPIPTRGRSRNKSGMINGIWYRSSYERKFIEYCVAQNINIQSASNTKFRVLYYHNGKKHYFYPDFYLPELDLVLEIKAGWQWIDEQVQTKADAARYEYNFVMIDEEELSDLNSFFLGLSL